MFDLTSDLFVIRMSDIVDRRIIITEKIMK